MLKYKAGFGRGFSCIRPDQKCIDEKTLNKDYFLEYSINVMNWKCYLNTKENIKNKQCGIRYGNLCNLKLEYRYCPSYIDIKPDLDRNELPIPELDNYNSQKRSFAFIKGRQLHISVNNDDEQKYLKIGTLRKNTDILMKFFYPKEENHRLYFNTMKVILLMINMMVKENIFIIIVNIILDK